MTVSEIESFLSSLGIESALSEAYIIASKLTGKSYAMLRADRNLDISGDELDRILEKRKERYPLQYLIGEWEFCGLPFKVTKDTLIPRPDTEIIAEKAASLLKPCGSILDLCTGSGCILAAALRLSSNRKGTAVELFPDTAKVAAENFSALGLDVETIVGDATTDLFGEEVTFDVITANPPYVTADEMNDLEPELSFEPHAALTDDGDGLSVIRKIIEVYKNHLASDGAMIIEHGYRQSDSVIEIANENNLSAEVLTDYGGNKRGVVLTHRQCINP